MASRRSSLWIATDSTPPPNMLDLSPLSRSARHSVMPGMFREKRPAFQRAGTTPNTSSFKSTPTTPSTPSSSYIATPPTLSRRPSTSTLSTLKGRFLRKRPSTPLFSSTPRVSERSPTARIASRIPEDVMYISSPTQLQSMGKLPVQHDTSPIAKRTKSAASSQVGTLSHTRALGESSVPRSRGSVDVDVCKDGYRTKDWFHKQSSMKLHPYPKQEARYMQGYNRILLENDRSTHTLLQRLNRNCSPSFHDYGSRPPRNVLDLGCGEGTWAAEAATTWKQFGSTITAFDLVAIFGDDAKTLDNISWRRGNFVEYPLPFRSNSFNLVRLANLTLCIPSSKWEFVLREVKRVLAPGGRIEIIDDELMFPYAPKSPEHSASASMASFDDFRHPGTSSRRNSQPPRSPTSSFFDMGSDVTPSLYNGTTPSDTDFEDLPTPTEAEMDISGPGPSSSTFSLVSPDVPQSSQDIETIFEAMLKGSHEIHTQPHEFLLDLLRRVFGPASKAREMQSFNLFLPAIESGSFPISRDERKSAFSDWEYVEKQRIERLGEEHLAQAQSEGKLNAKAAKLLGVTLQPMDGASKESLASVSETEELLKPVEHSPSLLNSTLLFSRPLHLKPGASPKPRSYQPAGLVLYPNTFIPMPPSELEMHVCKHIHTLLGCKVALGEYIATFLDDNGNRLVSEQEWDEGIWRYECSRRRRFNLPDEDFDNQKRSNTSTPNSNLRPLRFGGSPGPSNECLPHSDTHVRSIRVFEAYRT